MLEASLYIQKIDMYVYVKVSVIAIQINWYSFLSIAFPSDVLVDGRQLVNNYTVSWIIFKLGA